VLAGAALQTNVGQAQIRTAITSSGLGTTVTPPPAGGTVYQITDGTRRGTNLFHSFGLFSIGAGDTASFRNTTPALTTTNILSRVTGGERSNIFGTINTLSYPGANLFLINPAGVLFGPNASLNVAGSFHVSTSDFIRLAGGEIFPANPNSPTVLTVAPPSSFGFLTPTPAPISILGSTLQMPAGQSLSVVGGNIVIFGAALQAPSGRISLTSVASPGEVGFNSAMQSPEINAANFSALGQILIRGSLVNASGDPSGSVVIRGGRLIIDQLAFVGAFTRNINGATPSIDVHVTDDIVADSGARIEARTAGDGNAGDVQIEGKRLIVTGGAQINSSSGFFDSTTGLLSAGKGHGGNVTITVADSISLTGQTSGLFSSTLGSGNAGMISISAPTVALTDGAQIGVSTAGAGQGGSVIVAATESVSLTGPNSGLASNTFGGGNAGTIAISTPVLKVEDSARIEARTIGDGNAGDVQIEGKQLIVTGGAQINSGSGFFDSTTGRLFAGKGHGGNVTVTASDSISLTGQNSTGQTSGLFNSTLGPGDTGMISISAPTVALTDGAQVGASTAGAGQGGNVTVVATDAISISGRAGSGSAGGLFSNTFLSSGDSGPLFVSAPTLTMDGGFIRANAAFGSGNLGEIRVEAGRLTLTGGAMIGSLATGSGKGGNITVAARESVSISGRTSGIASFAAGDPGSLSLSAPTVTIDGGAVGAPSLALGEVTGGRAGDISVKADNLLTLSSGGQINSSTFTNSSGGNVSIETGRLIVSGGAEILAISGFRDPAMGTIVAGRGAAGNVTVVATESVSLSGPNSGLASNTFGGGNAGTIAISTPVLKLEDGAHIEASTASDGKAGDVRIDAKQLIVTGGAEILAVSGLGRGAAGNVAVAATESVSLSGPNSGLASNTFGGGNAGTIAISTPVLKLEDRARIEARTAGDGNAGDVRIEGNQQIQGKQLIVTGGAQINSSSGLFDSTTGKLVAGNGQGGNIRVTVTDSIALAGPTSGLFSSTLGSGNAGMISISAPTVALTDGAQIGASTAGAGQGGNVTVAATESVSLSGPNSELASNTFGGGNAGMISVSTPNLAIANGARIEAQTAGAGQGGNVTVVATESVSFSGPNSGLASNTFGSGNAGTIAISTPVLKVEDSARIEARTIGDGSAGDVRIEGKRLIVTGGAQINSSSGFVDSTTGHLFAGQGHGGNVTVTASDSISLTGQNSAGQTSGLFNSTLGPGDAGMISISPPSLVVADDARIEAATFGGGRGGNVHVDTGEMRLVDGGAIDTVTSGPGNGGHLEVIAKDVSISGLGSNRVFSGLFTNADLGSRNTRANAGDLAITTDALRVSDGGVISGITLSEGKGSSFLIKTGTLSLTGGGLIATSTSGPGDAGSIIIQATRSVFIGGTLDTERFKEHNPRVSDTSGIFSNAVSIIGLTKLGNAGSIDLSAPASLVLADGGEISTNSTGDGIGGKISLRATRVELGNNATISAKSSGTGDAGNVTIAAGDTFRSVGSAVTTEAREADGGNISLTAGSLAHLIKSQITTSVESGKGKGGNITIDPRFVVLDNSQIRADAFGGPGGNVHIVADVYLTSDSIVSASSALGVPGTINVQASITDLSGSVARLPEVLLQAGTLLRASCAARLAAGKASSLVVAGREGLPLEPVGYLPSPLVADELSAQPSRSEGHRWEMFPRFSRSVLAPACSRW